MAGESMSALLHHLHKVLNAETTRQLSDGEALRRFAGQREESAFAALMHRYGPLVLGVCRHFLRHEQDAEDAFQATFLVLAKKADSIRKERSVASWLYGVACRVALKARRSAARRRRHEALAPARAEPAPPPDLAWRELQAVLDEELNRLPEKYRKPFVLCCLAARSKKEAAEELGWKEGTVSSRLAQARKLLQLRLARRGVELSAVLAGLAVAQEGSAVTVPPSVAAVTLQAGLSFAADGTPGAAGSAQAVAWARAVLRAMSLARLRLPATLLLLLALAGGGAAVMLRRPQAPPWAAADAEAKPGRGRGAGPAAQPAPDAADKDGAKAAGETATVTGQVLTPQDKAAAGAQVVVLAPRPRRAGEPNPSALKPMDVLATGTADDQGHFRLAIPRSALRYRAQPIILTSRAGFAPTLARLDPLLGDREIPAKLEPAQSFRGRLLGPDGSPARGVRLHVTGLDRPLRQGPNRTGPQGLALRFHAPPGPLPAWPAPVTTDDNGRFVFEGLGPSLTVDVEVHDPRYATQRFYLRTGPTEQAREVTFNLAPARTLEGRITAEDTGLPLANAFVTVEGARLDEANLRCAVDGRTDADGRFRLRPFPGQDFHLRIWPPTGSPYLITRKSFRWPGPAARHELALALRRGVLVRGRVSEEGSGRPVAGASVRSVPYRGQGARPGLDPTDGSVEHSPWDASTGPDGSFALAVFPGKNHLLVQGPTPDYLHVETTSQHLQLGRHGGLHWFPDALVPLDLRPNANPPPVSVSLRRGVTVRGRVVGHDGKEVKSGVLVAPTNTSPDGELSGDPLPVRDGRFELPGCEPKKSVYVWVFTPAGLQGAYAKVRARPNEEPVIRLARCSSASVRLVDPAGQPLARPRAMLELVLRPGPGEDEPGGNGPGAHLTVPASVLYGRGFWIFEGKGDGALRFPFLIPGAPYGLRAEEKLGWPIKLTFTAAPGPRVLNLGDVAVNPRQPRRP